MDPPRQDAESDIAPSKYWRNPYSSIVPIRLIDLGEGQGLLKRKNFGDAPGVQALDAAHLVQTFIEDAHRRTMILANVNNRNLERIKSISFKFQTKQ